MTDLYPRSAELAEIAQGNAASHDWYQPKDQAIRCRTCGTVVFAGEYHLPAGTVPPCSTTPCCSFSPWHEIGYHVAGGQCIFCKTVYPPTVDVPEAVKAEALAALAERGFVTAVVAVRRSCPALSLAQCGAYVKQLRGLGGQRAGTR